MKNWPRLSVLLVGLALFAWAVPAALAQQQPPGGPPPAGGQGRGAADRRGVNQNEVQLWFDAMVVVQAQKALGLSDAQYPQFVGRLKALQDARRRAAGQRNRLVGELNRLTNASVTSLDEAQVREKLKALDDLRATSAAEIQKAYADLDQVLDLRQQARFRVFEEQVERRKFEFLLNARRRGTEPGAAQQM
jgi:Spy/CpxP family protein refolding chaperone